MSINGTVSAGSVKGSVNGAKVLNTDSYAIALANGFEGTVEQWLESLKGVGIDYIDSIHSESKRETQLEISFTDGNVVNVFIPDGKDGEAGVNGADGKDGTSVSVASVVESTADGGENVVTFDNGMTLTVRNGTKGAQGEKGDSDTRVLLWQNPDPGEEFQEQVVNVPIYEYDGVEILFHIADDGGLCNTGFIPGIDDSHYGSGYYFHDGVMASRPYTIEAEGIYFGRGCYQMFNSSNIDTNDIYMIPYRIYGIKLASPKLMQFSVDGVLYSAEVGMTWAAWVDSEYNTLGATYDARNVYGPDGTQISYNGNSFSKTVEIVAGQQYVTQL